MSGHRKPRILCVSRSEYQLRTICSSIPSQEYEIVSASTPEQAVAVCVSNQLAAVVLDSEFVTDGWSAAKTLKLVNPKVPVVLLGWNDDKDAPHGVDAIAATYSHLAHKLEALLKTRP
jgi:CheY-like chemotaxis protein